ncbi:MAG: hypothetical protein KatS3mg077_0469 [Candidatus Binatia bacterium]|nr:MAG: hypothetical protein KatS3mg077_0469 [Candidatus Binatia bacterium]
MPRARRRSKNKRGKHERIALYGVVFTVALLIRLAYVDSVRESPGAVILQTNPLRYHGWAQAILDRNAPLPPFDQPPAYAYFVAFVYALHGSDPQAVRVVQAVAGALQCVLLAALAAYNGIVGAAWATGLLAAAYGPFVYFTGEILPATISLLLVTAAVILSVRQRWAPAAALWLLAAFFRAEFLLPALVYAGYVWARGNRRAARTLAGVVTAGWVGASLVCSMVAGRLVPYTTGLGLNLWLGNNPFADGVSPFPPVELQAAVERARLAARHDAVRLDGWFLTEAFRFWREYPLEAAWLSWKKFRWTLVDRELPNTANVEWQESYSWLFSIPLFPISFGVLLCLAAAGFACPTQGRHRPSDSALLILALSTLAWCTAVFTNGRFRLPLALLLLVRGGEVVGAAFSAPARKQFRLCAPQVLLAVGLAGWLAFSNPYQVNRYSIAALDANAGVAERLAGHPERAIALLEKALAAQRDDDLAWAHLALAREQTGDSTGALNAYIDGLAFVPRSEDLQRLAREFSNRHGMDDDWVALFTGGASPADRHALRMRLIQQLQRRQRKGDSPNP